MARFTKKQYMDALIENSGNAINIEEVKKVMKKDLGEKGFNTFFSNMPNDSFGADDGDVADETIYFRQGASKDMQESRTERAKARRPKLRPKPEDEISAGFANLSKAAQELGIGKNKGGLAKKTKGFKQGGLAGTGHNDMRKGGLFK
jgi:hypothetical protein|tara:strand:- start:82 stop:522 length:441 start_codon:yes stop_codon:yes gene_type:complete